MKRIALLSLLLISSKLIAQTYTMTNFAGGFFDPVAITQAPGDDRLYVVERNGSIRIVNLDGSVVAGDWLNITSRVYDNNNEQGLLGLAFDPDYQNNGYFYVNYTVDSTGGSVDGDTRVSRFSRSTTNPLVADPNSEVILLRISQPYWNHDGGGLAFGPDGYLYIGMGDGGSGGDPLNMGQDPLELLGKMLRINVDAPTYTSPVSNPFYGNASYLPEIWALGVRNPWRFNFDRLSGDLWIGDVGQNAHEEVNHIERAINPNGGENYGWRCYEGAFPFNTTGCAPMSNYDFPVANIPQSTGPMCSITMGEVYRGAKHGDLYNKMIFSDYCNDYFWTITYDTTGVATYDTTRHNNISGTNFIVTIVQDKGGNVYLANFTDDDIYILNSSSCTPAAVIETPMNRTVTCDGNPIELVSAPGYNLTYQWLFNGTPIGGATDSTYSATAAGNYQLIVTNPSCGVNPTDTSDVLVLGSSTTPAVTLTSPQDTVCSTFSNFTLTGAPSGGNFLSPYVDLAGDFYTQVAGIGSHEVVYEYTDAGGCTGYDTVTIEVNNGPAVSFSLTPDSICSYDPILALSGGSPSGGTYSGTSVSGGNFDPSVGAGNYVITYTYTDSIGCTNFATDNILVSGCLGLDDIEISEFVVYPNPADELINISFNATVENNFELTILGVDGKVIHTSIVPVMNGQNNFPLDVSTIASGVYFIKLQDNIRTYTKKFVIR